MRLDSRLEHFRQVPSAGEWKVLEERNRSAPAHRTRYYFPGGILLQARLICPVCSVAAGQQQPALPGGKLHFSSV